MLTPYHLLHSNLYLFDHAICILHWEKWFIFHFPRRFSSTRLSFSSVISLSLSLQVKNKSRFVVWMHWIDGNMGSMAYDGDGVKALNSHWAISFEVRLRRMQIYPVAGHFTATRIADDESGTNGRVKYVVKFLTHNSWLFILRYFPFFLFSKKRHDHHTAIRQLKHLTSETVRWGII